jgi:hypothetical protein
MARNCPATSTLPGIYLNASHSRQASRTLPRRVHRRIRFTRFYFQAVWAIWRGVALGFLYSKVRKATWPSLERR